MHTLIITLLALACFAFITWMLKLAHEADDAEAKEREERTRHLAEDRQAFHAQARRWSDTRSGV